MANKAHAAVVRRIAQRYGLCKQHCHGFDCSGDGLTVEVETTATLEEGLTRLLQASGRRFLAVTNKEAISEALRLTETTEIGVMDPWGEIVREANAKN